MANLIFDIDGTLRNFEKEPNIDPNLVKYLVASQNKNRNIVVTGRTVANLNIFFREINCSANIFSKIYCEDGLINLENGNVAFLANPTELSQLKIARKYIDQIVINTNEFKASYPDKHLRGDGVIIIQESYDSMPFMKHLTSYLAKNNLLYLNINHLTHNRLSVSVNNISKCSAIKVSQIKLSESYYFCDEKNDLELARLIQESRGKVICPSNAIKEIKRIAHYVSTQPYSFGVVDYLSKIL